MGFCTEKPLQCPESLVCKINTDTLRCLRKLIKALDTVTCYGRTSTENENSCRVNYISYGLFRHFYLKTATLKGWDQSHKVRLMHMNEIRLSQGQNQNISIQSSYLPLGHDSSHTKQNIYLK